MRVSRMWRDLLNRKRAGFGHNAMDPQKGDLALFCPACPQPGINLPDAWAEKYDEYVICLLVSTLLNFPTVIRLHFVMW